MVPPNGSGQRLKELWLEIMQLEIVLSEGLRLEKLRLEEGSEESCDNIIYCCSRNVILMLLKNFFLFSYDVFELPGKHPLWCS
jgi:hypothetical protein